MLQTPKQKQKPGKKKKVTPLTKDTIFNSKNMKTKIKKKKKKE